MIVFFTEISEQLTSLYEGALFDTLRNTIQLSTANFKTHFVLFGKIPTIRATTAIMLLETEPTGLNTKLCPRLLIGQPIQSFLFLLSFLGIVRLKRLLCWMSRFSTFSRNTFHLQALRLPPPPPQDEEANDTHQGFQSNHVKAWFGKRDHHSWKPVPQTM